MSPEAIPFPESKPTLDTPETAQECLDLASMITDQVDLWKSRSHSPILRGRSFARFINEDCEPLGREPIDYMGDAGFGGSRSIEEAAFLTNYEKRRVVLSEWVTNETLDTIPAHNKAFSEYFEQIATFSKNPYAPEEYQHALQSIWRLFILREQLAVKVGRVENLDISSFVVLTVRLANDLS